MSSTPSKFRKKPVVVRAYRWWKNNDHPFDGDPSTEGDIVRYYRHPDVLGDARHCDLPDTKRGDCTARMNDHGWIDTIEGGHTVCPGDWIITGVRGEVYPCEASIFAETYEAVTR